MAIATDSTVTEHGITFGLSKTLDQIVSDLTVDNLRQFAICGWTDLMVKRSKSQAANPRNDMPAAITVPQSPWQTSLDAGNAFIPYYNNNVSLDNIDYYGFNVLVYGANNINLMTSTDLENYRLVTNISDYQLLYADGGSKTTNSDYNGTVITCTHTADGTPRTYTCMNPCGNHKLFSSVDDGELNVQPMACIPYNDTFFLCKGFYFPGVSSSGVQTPGWSNFTGLQNYYLALKNSHDYTQQSYHLNGGLNIRDLSQITWLKTWGGATVSTFLETDDANTYNAIYDLDAHTVMLMSRGNISWGTCEVMYNLAAKDWDTVLHEMAFAGVKFKVDNITYRPVISGGVVTGYTDDPAVPSEYDNITNVTGNNVPSGPPAPVPAGDEDNTDPIATAGAPFAAGLCHYYALTAGSVLLDHISEALGTWDIENTHKDLYKNLVSCKLIKPPAPIPTTGSEAFTIYGVKPQYSGADITLPVVSGNPDATFGPFQISRKFNDFRDYAPYTRVSIYLPYCGWCDLPSHVVGRSVSVHYYTDIIAATCKAVVFCGNNIIAEAAGVIGLDIPFVADNVGAKMQAVTAGMIAALGGGIQLGAGIGTMAATKSGNGAKAALSGASQYLSGYSQMAMAFNENTTEISGKNGDGCCLSGATNIIIKIVRPKKGAYTTAPYTPPGYGHNIGYVSQKQVRVSSVSGLLIADNVDTSGISGATEAERAEIRRVLETGLIVNAAPE